MTKLKIQLIETDSLDENNNYYLYEVTGDNFHYYVSCSDEEIDEYDRGDLDFSNEYTMLERHQFTDREWEIAKYLFMFLWDSSNGTNTCVEEEIYNDDGFTREEMIDFVDKFGFSDLGVLEVYEEGGIEIYWAYFSCFNLITCNMFEDR